MLDAQPCGSTQGGYPLHEVDDPGHSEVADRMDCDVAAGSQRFGRHLLVELAQPEGAGRVSVTERGVHRSGVAAEAAVSEPLETLPAHPGAGRRQPRRRLVKLPCGVGDDVRPHLDGDPRPGRGHDLGLVAERRPCSLASSQHRTDAGDAQRGKPAERPGHGGGLHLGRHRRQRFGDQVDGRFAEDAGRTAVLVPVDHAAPGIRCSGTDTGEGEGGVVGHGDVSAVAVEDHGPVVRCGVDLGRGRQPCFGERLVVEAEADQRCSGRKLGGRGGNCVEHVSQVTGLPERETGDRGGVGDGVEVGVAQTRDDGRSGKSDLMIRSSTQRIRGAGCDDDPVFDEQRVALDAPMRPQRIRRDQDGHQPATGLSPSSHSNGGYSSTRLSIHATVRVDQVSHPLKMRWRSVGKTPLR